jgi:hypothetical protein
LKLFSKKHKKNGGAAARGKYARGLRRPRLAVASSYRRGRGALSGITACVRFSAAAFLRRAYL